MINNDLEDFTIIEPVSSPQKEETTFHPDRVVIPDYLKTVPVKNYKTVHVCVALNSKDSENNLSILNADIYGPLIREMTNNLLDAGESLQNVRVKLYAITLVEGAARVLTQKVRTYLEELSANTGPIKGLINKLESLSDSYRDPNLKTKLDSVMEYANKIIKGSYFSNTIPVPYSELLSRARFSLLLSPIKERCAGESFLLELSSFNPTKKDLSLIETFDYFINCQKEDVIQKVKDNDSKRQHKGRVASEEADTKLEANKMVMKNLDIKSPGVDIGQEGKTDPVRKHSKKSKRK